MKKMLFLFGLVSMMYACRTNGPEPETVSLTDQEKNDLLFLREEEKLARDVYLYAYDQYGLQIFSNIAGSEQRHMDQVLALLTKYGLEDPASPNRGEFSHAELQTLYNDLTAIVDSSQTDALWVGATIEDLDIHDITTFESHTDKQDLLDVYARLTCGSRNHMRNFYRELQAVGVTYTAQYISQQELDEIVNSSNERCGGQ